MEHLLEKAATRFGLARVIATDEDIRLLQNYDWPGNIRELGAVIDRAGPPRRRSFARGRRRPRRAQPARRHPVTVPSTAPLGPPPATAGAEPRLGIAR